MSRQQSTFTSIPSTTARKSCPDRESSLACLNGAGFTLVELLVVLVIVSLIAGVSLPRLSALYASVENAGQRGLIIDQVEGLGYQAYISGRSIVLGASRESEDPASKYPLQLPPGWRIDVASPVRYSAQGTCGGGKLTISDPNGGRQAFRLAPPMCRLQPAEPGEP